MAHTENSSTAPNPARERTIAALGALARGASRLPADDLHTIVAGQLPHLDNGARERLWVQIVLADRARNWLTVGYLTNGQHGWHPDHFVTRAAGETDEHVMGRARAVTEQRIVDCCTAAAIADEVTRDEQADNEQRPLAVAR